MSDLQLFPTLFYLLLPPWGPEKQNTCFARLSWVRSVHSLWSDQWDLSILGASGKGFALLIKETDKTYPIPPFITSSAHRCAAQHCSGQLAKWRRGPKSFRVPGSFTVEPQELDFLLWRKKWTPVSSSHCRRILCCFLPSSFPAAPTSQIILLVSFRTLVRSSTSWPQCLQREDSDSGQSWAMYPRAEWLPLCLPEGTQGRWGWGDAAAAQHRKQKRRQKPQARSAREQSRVERATRCLPEPHSFSSNFAFRPRIELHCLLTPWVGRRDSQLLGGD